MLFKKIGFYSFVTIFYFTIQPINSQLIGHIQYFTDVCRSFILDIQSMEITGNAMPMREFTNSINATHFGSIALGDVRFHSGFITSIDEARIVTAPPPEPILSEYNTYSEIPGQLSLHRVRIVYDLDYDLSTFQGKGTLIIHYPELRFDVKIRSNYADDVVTATIKFGTTYGDVLTDVFPIKAEPQILARHFRNSFNFRQPLQKSFDDWQPTFQHSIDRAIKLHSYPEMSRI